MSDYALPLLLLLAIAGCGAAPSASDGPTGAKVANNPAPAANYKATRLTIRVLNADEHLGHSTAAEGSSVHPVWCDGCRAQIVGKKDEELMLWWDNGEIMNYPFQFQDGKTYTLHIQGEFGDGVMGYQGKCIHVGQVLKVEEGP